jgi:hypothetical protein
MIGRPCALERRVKETRDTCTMKQVTHLGSLCKHDYLLRKRNITVRKLICTPMRYDLLYLLQYARLDVNHSLGHGERDFGKETHCFRLCGFHVNGFANLDII